MEPDRCAVSTSSRTHKANFCSEHSEASGDFYFLFFTGERLGPLGAPEPLSPRPCPLRCDGAFPEGARLARVASSPPQRPYREIGPYVAEKFSRRCTTKDLPQLRGSFGPVWSACFRAPLVRWYSGHLTSRNFYMIFICKLLHPAPLMNSPSSSTCSHLLLVTSSHSDFPGGGVMTRLSSPVGVLAP